jgi:hypothetical protein
MAVDHTMFAIVIEAEIMKIIESVTSSGGCFGRDGQQLQAVQALIDLQSQLLAELLERIQLETDEQPTTLRAAHLGGRGKERVDDFLAWRGRCEVFDVEEDLSLFRVVGIHWVSVSVSNVCRVLR